MKKNLCMNLYGIAAICSWTGVAHAQSSVTIYGILDTSVAYSSPVATSAVGAAAGARGSRFSVDSGNLSGSRLGFLGTEDLGGGLRAIFNLESGFSMDTGAMGSNGNPAPGGLIFGRKATVGLSGGLGTVQAGRQKDFIDDVAVYTSIVPFGGMVYNIHGNNLDRTQGARVNNSVRYDSPNMNGLVANVTLGFGENAGANAAGQSFGTGANYTNGPFAIGAGYFQAKLGNSSSDGSSTFAADCAAGSGAAGSTCLKTWTIGASYQAGPTRFYGSYSDVRQPLATAASSSSYDTTVALSFTPRTGVTPFTFGSLNNAAIKIVDLGLMHQLNERVSLLGAVQYARARFVNAANGKATQFNVGVDYALSKRTDLYALYGYQRTANMYSPGVALGVVPGASNAASMALLGIRHKF